MSGGTNCAGVRLPGFQRGFSATGGPTFPDVAVLLLLLLLLQTSGGRSEPQGDGDGDGDGSVTDLSPKTEEVVSSSYSCLEAGCRNQEPERTFVSRNPGTSEPSLGHHSEVLTVCVCVFTRKIKSGLDDVSSELCGDGCLKV